MMIWSIVSYISEPADDIVMSHEQLKTMEVEVNRLMLKVTEGLGEPKDIFQLTKNWGSSLTYYYYNYIPNVEIVEKNIRSQDYWREISPRVEDDSEIFKSYCYDDISLNLSTNRVGVPGDFTVDIAWQKDSYCWKQFHYGN